MFFQLGGFDFGKYESMAAEKARESQMGRRIETIS
jgi:hypothetical protein